MLRVHRMNGVLMAIYNMVIEGDPAPVHMRPGFHASDQKLRSLWYSEYEEVRTLPKATRQRTVGSQMVSEHAKQEGQMREGRTKAST